MGGILVIEFKASECGWVFVGCNLWSMGEFQILVPELDCLWSWFKNSIIFKSFRFLIYLIRLDGFPP
jgi:hypothetical protein